MKRPASLLAACAALLSCSNAGLYALDGSGPGRADRATFEGIACVPPAAGEVFPTKVSVRDPGRAGRGSEPRGGDPRRPRLHRHPLLAPVHRLRPARAPHRGHRPRRQLPAGGHAAGGAGPVRLLPGAGPVVGARAVAAGRSRSSPATCSPPARGRWRAPATWWRWWCCTADASCANPRSTRASTALPGAGLHGSPGVQRLRALASSPSEHHRPDAEPRRRRGAGAADLRGAQLGRRSAGAWSRWRPSPAPAAPSPSWSPRTSSRTALNGLNYASFQRALVLKRLIALQPQRPSRAPARRSPTATATGWRTRTRPRSAPTRTTRTPTATA